MYQYVLTAVLPVVIPRVYATSGAAVDTRQIALRRREVPDDSVDSCCCCSSTLGRPFRTLFVSHITSCLRYYWVETLWNATLRNLGHLRNSHAPAPPPPQGNLALFHAFVAECTPPYKRYVWFFSRAQEAKKDSDTFLTELINRELAQRSGQGGELASSKTESRPGPNEAEVAQPEAMELCRAEGGDSSGPERGDASVGVQSGRRVYRTCCVSVARCRPEWGRLVDRAYDSALPEPLVRYAWKR